MDFVDKVAEVQHKPYKLLIALCWKLFVTGSESYSTFFAYIHIAQASLNPFLNKSEENCLIVDCLVTARICKA